MTLPSYLSKFFLYDIHKRYFVTLFRSVILLSHRFGLIVMIKSLFKPLFGMNGIFSRINGFVIRSLSIVLATIIIAIYLALGICGYVGIYVLAFSFLLTKPIYVLIFLLFLLACALYNYYFNSPIFVGGKRLHTLWNTKILCISASSGNSKPLYNTFRSSADIKEVLIMAELPFEDTLNFLAEHVTEFDTNAFKAKITELIQTNIFEDGHLRTADLFCAYLLQAKNVTSLMNKYKCDESTLIEALRFLHRLKAADPKIWDDNFQIPPAGGIDRGWAIAYTPTINRSGVDLTKQALKGTLPRLVGRQDVKENIISTLSKSSNNNVLLIGDAGSGKTTFIKAIAREIALGTPIPALKFKRIVSVDIAALTAGKSSDAGKIASQIAREAEISGNIILFVDEIHNLATLSSEDPNASTAFAVLEPYLSAGKFQFIGTTSYDNYLKYVKPNEAFARTFDVHNLRATTDEETVNIMENEAKTIEERTRMRFTYPAIKIILDSGKRYVNDRALPDKALSILNRVYSEKRNSDKLITKEDILTFVSKQFHIPVKSIDASEKEILLNIENIMHQKIVGQETAITMISKALKRARAGIRDENKPIASFLFAGPTGVGKTETAKVLAESYFGDPKSMIRVDMSEYQSADSISRLIGDKGQVGYLISKIQENPHSLILLDEIEKADKNVLNLFLQVLDDGRLTSASGKTYDFSNSFIIMTTNVGNKVIAKAVAENGDVPEVALLELKAYFPLEFLNRFTAVIPYSPLTKENVFAITKIKLAGLQKKIQEKKINVEFSDAVVKQIAEMAYSPDWGARELNRLVEDKVETAIAEKIIAGEINSGDTYKFDMIQ